jgi:Protein of unknown function (DUF5818)
MRHLLLFAVLLLSLSWAAAQSYPSQGSTGAQETVKGCISSAGGTYTLTAKDGKTYQLTGDTAKLNDHVGHEMKVTGTETPASASSGSAMGKSSSGPTLDVTSFKHISKTCEGGGAMSH